MANLYQHGFDAVNNTLDFGFQRINSGLNDINSSINAMSDAICNKLDEIHDIVNNPRLTQARELFRRAATNFEKGYYEEALEDCKAAVEKEKTDFISWYLLGQIYLYGAGKFSNVINLPEAETALTNAAKYIDADLESSEDAKQMASQIYYHLSQAKYYLSNDLLIEGKENESQAKLEEAEKFVRQSNNLNPDIELLYTEAKYFHYLGKDKEALDIVDELIEKDQSYALKASNDKSFESIWSQIDELIEEKRKSIVSFISEKLNRLFAEAESLIDYEQVKINSAFNPHIEYIQAETSTIFGVSELKEKYLTNLNQAKTLFLENAAKQKDETNEVIKKFSDILYSLPQRDYLSLRSLKKTILENFIDSLNSIPLSCHETYEVGDFTSANFDKEKEIYEEQEELGNEIKKITPYLLEYIEAHADKQRKESWKRDGLESWNLINGKRNDSGDFEFQLKKTYIRFRKEDCPLLFGKKYDYLFLKVKRGPVEVKVFNNDVFSGLKSLIIKGSALDVAYNDLYQQIDDFFSKKRFWF